MYFYIRVECPFTERIDRISKANSIQFENYSSVYDGIFDSFRTVEDLNIFRLSLYNYYKTLVSIHTKIYSEEINGEVYTFQGFSMESPVIRVSDNILAQCLPLYVRKLFFVYSKDLNKYVNKFDFIRNYSF